MEICSRDTELEATFFSWLGPKNESTYETCTRLYDGLNDRFCRPPRKAYPDSAYNAPGWNLTRFSLGTSGHSSLACIFYDKERGEDSDEEAEQCGFKDSGGNIDVNSHGKEDDNDETELEKQFEKNELIFVYVHTNTTCCYDAKEVLPVCEALNACLVSYDLRGHGKSDGEGLVDLKTNLRDLEQVIAWARSKTNKMVLWARGAATCLASRYQSLMCEKIANGAKIDNPIKYLVLDSPFVSCKRMFDDCVETVREKKYGNIPHTVFLMVAKFFRKGVKKRLNGMDPFDVKQDCDMPKITIPASFLIAVDDDYIPPQHGMELASAYRGPIFARMFQGRHFTPREEEVVMGTVAQIKSRVD